MGLQLLEHPGFASHLTGLLRNLASQVTYKHKLIMGNGGGLAQMYFTRDALKGAGWNSAEPVDVFSHLLVSREAAFSAVFRQAFPSCEGLKQQTSLTCVAEATEFCCSHACLVSL